jgi:hypothetical protein
LQRLCCGGDVSWAKRENYSTLTVNKINRKSQDCFSIFSLLTQS